MLRPFARSCVFLLCAVLVTGCFGREKPQGPRAKIVRFPKANATPGEPRLVGRVTMVNEEGRFVLVSCDAWSPPEEGTALKCLRDGQETAIISTSPERRGAHVTADIVTGTPQRGDQVFQ